MDLSNACEVLLLLALSLHHLEPRLAHQALSIYPVDAVVELATSIDVQVVVWVAFRTGLT